MVAGCCRHTGGTGTVAGIADTVDTDAFAGSTPNKTWRGTKTTGLMHTIWFYAPFKSCWTDSIGGKVENTISSCTTEV